MTFVGWNKEGTFPSHPGAMFHPVTVFLSATLFVPPLYLLIWMQSAVPHVFGSCTTAVQLCKTWFLLFMKAAMAARWAAQREYSFQLALRHYGTDLIASFPFRKIRRWAWGIEKCKMNRHGCILFVPVFVLLVIAYDAHVSSKRNYTWIW